MFTPDSMQPKKRKMETLLPESVKNEESIDEIKKRAKLTAKPTESKKENEPECENCELWIVQKNPWINQNIYIWRFTQIETKFWLNFVTWKRPINNDLYPIQGGGHYCGFGLAENLFSPLPLCCGHCGIPLRCDDSRNVFQKLKILANFAKIFT